jgi:ABC-2 type transport system permease protein/lipopolysaccharide transport system permease protein
MPEAFVRRMAAEPAPAEAGRATPPPVSITAAARDLIAGLRAVELWSLMGWQDIQLRYRRSVLGPFWLTASMAAQIIGIGLLYGGLFRSPLDEYLPFLCAGFLTWGLISALINDGCVAFIEGESLIKQMRLPLSLFVFRGMWRSLIILGHNLVVYVAVMSVFGIWPGLPLLLAFPGLVLILAAGGWLALALAVIGARFRDVPQIVASILQVTFFLSPIMWQPHLLSGRTFVVDFNPVYHFIEILRAPLLGQVAAPSHWISALAIALMGWLAVIPFYARYRRRVPFYL